MHYFYIYNSMFHYKLELHIELDITSFYPSPLDFYQKKIFQSVNICKQKYNFIFNIVVVNTHTNLRTWCLLLYQE